MRRVALAILVIAMPLSAQWKQNGKPVPDEPWRKSAGTFGAMLLLSDSPGEFVDQWKRPENPEIHTTATAERGHPIGAFVIFHQCKEVDGACKCNVDFAILRPDGTVYGKREGIEMWNGPASPGENLQLGRASFGVDIEPDDPAGKYTVQATVRDLNAAATVDLVQSFTVAPREKVTEISGSNAEEFMHTYYRSPHPELVLSMIRYMGRAGVPATEDHAAPIIGFLAEVFAQNPMMTAQWRAAAAETTGLTKRVLSAAFGVSRDLSFVTKFDPQTAGPDGNDLCWGAYFASGKPEYVRALVQRLAYLSERKSLQLYLTAASAQWSLSSNARQHVGVRRILDQEHEKASPQIRAAIEEAVESDPASLEEATTKIIRQQRDANVW